ncbi:MAG: hypothetical protein ACHQRK_05875 [Gemmatimonadales bacterium]
MSLRLSSRAALLALAAVASAQPLLAQGASAHRVANGVVLHPNHVKYSDAGKKPATGRSGSASLESRALVAKDGSALLEATTGSLDAGTAPGSIKKMQVKLLAVNGKVQSVQNFNAGSTSGYWSTTISGLGHDQKIQLQANVVGIDGHRTDVVTVMAPVERRPDISLDGLTAPARAMAGARINVVALVSEKNGDVGARTTCMFSVDGNLVDQASGIWVDAGQTVSCAFQTTIAAVGTHQLSVYATGVSPADWDQSNNGASASIQIMSAESPMSYSADFTASDYDYRTHDKSSSSDGTFVDETTVSGTRQSRSLNLSSWTTSNAFSFPVSVRTALSTGGNMVFDFTNDIAIAPNQSWAGADCGDLLLGGLYVSVCNNRYGLVARSQVDVSSFDGRVTYLGSRFYQTDGTDGYVTNRSSDTPSGVGAYTVGSDVQTILELKDARGVMFASRPTISLVSTPINDQWNSCIVNPWNGLTTCSDGLTQGTTKTGSANADQP